MILLAFGLILFLGTHSVRIFAEDWRTAQIVRMGERPWKILYSLMSLMGFVLMVWGYGQIQHTPVFWNPPTWARYVAGILTLPAFVLLAAAYVPATRLKAIFGQPMVFGVFLWAIAHLIANGDAAGVMLFGAFLVWAFIDYLSARRRDRLLGIRYPVGTLGQDVAAVVIGVVAWGLFAAWGHWWLFGVTPFGRGI